MNTMAHERSLVVLCRAPIAGQCKSRLIPELGVEGARQAYVELVEGTLLRLVPVAGRHVLCISEDHPLTDIWTDLLAGSLTYQKGVDLGSRMSNAMSAEFSAGAKSVCLVGTDCPPLNAAYVDQAFDALAHADVVLGPAEDGGYGLIAMRELQEAVFEGISWSTSKVLAETIAAAEKVALTVHLLPMIWDVDEPADWRRYLALDPLNDATWSETE